MSRQIEETPREGEPLLVGDCVVEPSLNRLTRAGVSIQLELRAVDVLLCLVAHAGEVVSKDVLLDTVWQTEFVSDNTLANYVAVLRSAFGDDAQQPRYIETIRKRGYRLIAEVRPLTVADEATPAVPEAIPSPDQERNPYPGLAAFTEADAEVFFGREAEIAALWRRITSRRLLAVIGPSGVGKSSLLRAGVAPRAPPGWRVVVFTPGETPALSLARALAPDHSGDPAAMARLLGFSDADTVLAVVSRWRGLFDEAVLVVDQFEELFTLNSPEVQTSFIGLLRRLVDAADIHLVLAMRDDYLYRCQNLDEIAPIFRELTPLPPPKAEGLRRALKEPAARQLYRFENELLVDRIVGEVEGERGALPMMAFAVHRLWEERDRKRRELTEEAYERIGGVAGALARHADATLERIGSERQPIVRELFRNLVTAEGTRAIREVDELLEVFENDDPPSSRTSDPGFLSSRSGDRGFLSSRASGASRGIPRSQERDQKAAISTAGGDPSIRSSDSLTRDDRDGEASYGLARDDRRRAAEEVLRELIDARLLTGYREQDHDDRPVHRVEIVHESLLDSWPRLVRWRTQDVDGARLRDELRQAARVWDDRERGNDYLWTGRAFREFALWREDYPGGLSAVEEEFASAMKTHATRSRRRRRVAVTAIIAVLLAVLVVVGTLWRRSVREAKRAEAAKLLALGQLRLEDYPTATLAHAIASLELADTPDARRLALRALWEGPTALIANDDLSMQALFSEEGGWVVQSMQKIADGGHLRVVTRDGSSNWLERVHESPLAFSGISPGGDIAYSSPTVEAGARQNLVLWSLPDGRILNETWFEPPSQLRRSVVGWNPNRMLMPVHDGQVWSIYAFNFDGTAELLGTIDLSISWKGMAIDRRTGGWFAVLAGDEVVVFEMSQHGMSDARILGRHEGEGRRIVFDPEGRLLATSSSDGRIKIWTPDEIGSQLEIDGPSGIDHLEISSSASRLEAYAVESGEITTWVWSIEDGRVRLLRRFPCGAEQGMFGNFLTLGWDASRTRFAKSGPGDVVRCWSLAAPAGADPIELKGGSEGVRFGQSFDPTGSWLATAGPDLALWPLDGPYPWVLPEHTNIVSSVQFAPDGQWLASGSHSGIARVVPLAGEVPVTSSFEYDGSAYIQDMAVSPDGSRLLVGHEYRGAVIVPLNGDPPSPLGSLIHVYEVAWSRDGRLAAVSAWGADSQTKIYVFDTDTLEETATLEPEETAGWVALDAKRSFLPDGRIMAAFYSSGLWVLNPSTGSNDLLFGGSCLTFSVTADGRKVALVNAPGGADEPLPNRLVLLDLDAGTETELSKFGDRLQSVTMDADGTIIAATDFDGVVRVGLLDGSEPHVLLGHDGFVFSVDIDPLGRWIATGGQDGTVRIWPMPDLSKPPLHTLPHDELMAKLKTLTNLRVVRDEESETGWTLSHDPFPGWETVPSW